MVVLTLSGLVILSKRVMEIVLGPNGKDEKGEIRLLVYSRSLLSFPPVEMVICVWFP